jgi:acyl carrier protein
MTVEDFHETIRSKVQGTWNLHNTAIQQKLSLDFFTLLSSISGIIGQKAQANYAAANVFLDSFAAYRHKLGLPACSVDLGVVEDVGYISEREALAERLDRQLWGGINEALLHKILKFSILQQTSPIHPASATQMITGIPVPQQEDSFLLRDARFAGLCVGHATPHGGQGAHGPDSSRRDVQAFIALVEAKVDHPTLLAGAVDVVNRQFTRSLGLSEPLEPAKPLSGYGMDSLAAVELRNWLRLQLGAEITTLEIINATSLLTLCEKIVAKLNAV